MKKNNPDKGKKSRKKQKGELKVPDNFVTLPVADVSQLVTLKPANELTLASSDAIRLPTDPITITIPTNQPIVNLDALNSARLTFETLRENHQQIVGTVLPTLQASNRFVTGLRDTLNAATTLPLKVISDSVFENTQKTFSQITSMDRPVNAIRESLLVFDENVSRFRETVSSGYITGLQSQLNQAALTISGSLVTAPQLAPTTIKPFNWLSTPLKPQFDITVGELSLVTEKKYAHSEVRAIVRAEVEGIRTYFEAKIGGLEQQLGKLKTPLLPASTKAKNEVAADFISKYRLGKEGLEYDRQVIVVANQNWRSSGEPSKDATNTWKILNTLFPSRLEIVGDCEKQWGEPMTYKDLKAKAGCADSRREIRRLKSLIEKSGHANKVELKTAKKPRSQRILLQLVVFDSLPTLRA
ncbi:hypothetical protein A3A71_04215 [Candidatus Berkelbacteria bacterium RIFCSPLOWO2_01_FULL_50_28]|uniref:Uncharacterized protein n=1 Tax=Candidatus Berkelbacteria bacterium RIFCSPLOWO2_01_FULL_50_28 TaxID=1797471 RepID=A0A1F5EA95_9BACT|nr:MAG: hypothetical protein A2807_03395 [Candidatus Berkelbacteria bacterium RIFCSPHIGHO2_01_FULL_50_36]OGD62444.1 MAG: hypothetical protein A3F39_01935 [Candidatus Berkelbacteria bacterium RIFCSPHIGHO2_12_FULL_50_11]OGD64337.1 MAG: hypothetical protein A3A71_04215 [Candidatus Berkelbacteria bacterium RIFCSPLOWO2_01_FULL_50_28]